MSSIDYLFLSYKNLFGAGNETVVEVTFEELEQSNDTSGIDFQAKWQWLIAVDRIANGDALKYEQVYSMRSVEFLNALSFLKDKINNENAELLKQQNRIA